MRFVGGWAEGAEARGAWEVGLGGREGRCGFGGGVEHAIEDCGVDDFVEKERLEECVGELGLGDEEGAGFVWMGYHECLCAGFVRLFDIEMKMSTYLHLRQHLNQLRRVHRR